MINKDMMQDVYSTNEIKTNKVWIDGKPVYRKVINVGDLSANVEHSINLNINNLGTIIDMCGFSNIPNNNFVVPINFYNFSDATGKYCFIDKRINKFLFKSGWGATGLYIILEYTKTTD